MYIERMLIGMIESMLPGSTDGKLALFMILNVNHHYGGKNIHKEFPIIIHRPSNYTKVLLYEKQNFTWRKLISSKGLYFTKMSDHDSCWRSDGFRFFSQNYFSAAKELGSDRPADVEVDYSFCVFDGDPRYLLLKDLRAKRDKETGYTEGYLVKVERKISLKEVGEYLKE